MLDPVNHVFTRDGVVVKLPPQPFRVLVRLVERRGALVTRAELRDAVWGAETVVDFEHGLNTCIRQIRQSLGDDAEVPRFIETVPRLGYRFIATVSGPTHAPVDARTDASSDALSHRSAGGAADSPATTPSTTTPDPGWRLSRRRLILAGGTLAMAAIGTAVLAYFPVRRASASDGVSSQARQLYVRGQLALEDPTPGGSRTAIELFEKALAVDARFAAAHAGIAHAYLMKPDSTTGLPPEVSAARAQVAIERALALDAFSPEAHLAAAELHMIRDDWPAAGRAYERAIEVAPHHSGVRQRFAVWLSLQARFEEAIKEARLGESLDPLSLRARTTLADVLRHARRFDEAIRQAQHALELNPNHGRAHAVLGHSYLAQGRLDAAIEEFGRSGNSRGNLGHAYALAGRIADARKILRALEEQFEATRGGSGEIAQVYIGLGEFDRAFEWLARAVEDGSGWTLKVAVVWDPLRSDRRFGELLRKVGL